MPSGSRVFVVLDWVPAVVIVMDSESDCNNTGVDCHLVILWRSKGRAEKKKGRKTLRRDQGPNLPSGSGKEPEGKNNTVDWLAEDLETGVEVWNGSRSGNRAEVSRKYLQFCADCTFLTQNLERRGKERDECGGTSGSFHYFLPHLTSPQVSLRTILQPHQESTTLSSPHLTTRRFEKFQLHLML